MDLYVVLAKKTIENWVKNKDLNPPSVKLPSEFFNSRAGIFVSIHLKSGELRGCIGTFLPTQPNIAQEIMANAIAAAGYDPRFQPIRFEELPNLTYSVDILSEPRTVKGFSSLNPLKYGLIVSTPDGRRGLLLPSIEGVKTSEEQFEICCQKGGIDPQEKVSLETFTVERHREE